MKAFPFLTTIFILVLCLNGNLGLPNQCPSTSMCQCTPQLINCTNTGDRQNLTIDLLFMMNDLQVLKIHGFDVVTLTSHFLHRAKPTLVSFDDLNTLIVTKVALQNSNFRQLQIMNVANLTVGLYGIELANISTILLSNVTVNYLEDNRINCKNVSEFVINHCTFGYLSNSAIKFENVTSLNVSNSKFKEVATKAFSAHGKATDATVNFDNTFTEVIWQEGFIFKDFDSITFDNCTFQNIHEMFIVANNVESFEFIRNDFKLLENLDNFSEIKARNVYFKNNYFQRIENKKLPSSGGNFTLENNYYNCNCSVAHDKETSGGEVCCLDTCNILNESQNLKSYQLVWNPEDNHCILLEGSLKWFSSTTPGDGSTTPGDDSAFITNENFTPNATIDVFYEVAESRNSAVTITTIACFSFIATFGLYFL